MCVQTPIVPFSTTTNNKVEPKVDIFPIRLQATELPKAIGQTTNLFCPLITFTSVLYCQSDLSLSLSFSLPPSFYVLHLSLCTPGRGSGAFCLVMWVELWDALHGSGLHIAEQLTTKKLHRAVLRETTWLTPTLPVSIFRITPCFSNYVTHACNEALPSLNPAILHNRRFTL